MTIPNTKILLVEDDRELLEFIRYMLQQEKYAVVTAMDGEEALAKAQAERPEAILMDVLLPKMHGFEVCQRLRQDPATCLIPIIMVTSLTAVKDRLTGFKLGADEYIPKPFEPVELLARLERLIERSRQNIAANPLTGLANATAFEQEVRQRLQGKDPYTVGLCDANHLARFNALYGFSRGDGVIRLLGTILRSALAELGNRTDTAAHFGGDDFAFVSTANRAEVVAARVLENVESLLPMQYDERSRERGFSVVKEADGRETPIPFLNVSIGLVDVTPGLYTHYAQVYDRMARALADAKGRGSNQMARLT
jgi:diguanylate cyclase (GGDEF)-like protein